MQLRVGEVIPAEPGEEREVAGLHVRLEAQHALALGSGAGRAYEVGSHTGSPACAGPCVVPHGQPAAGPPTQVGLGHRRQPHPAEDDAVGRPRDEHDRARVVIDGVGVARGREEPLLVDEGGAAEPPVCRPLAAVRLTDRAGRSGEPGEQGLGPALGRRGEGGSGGSGEEVGQAHDRSLPARQDALSTVCGLTVHCA